MLKLQEYLHAHGVDKLKEELGIRVYAHPDRVDSLLGFKYSQIDSPRTHPVVRECRGIVLEKDTWHIVAKPFDRFFNVGEVEDEFKLFDWDSFKCVNKEDGSLIIVYYYNGEWHANTSGSFGHGMAPYYDGTWRDLFWKTAKIDKDLLSKEHTYCFELCTPYNKVVKQYRSPRVYLLGVISTETLAECNEEGLNSIAELLKVNRPVMHVASSKECVAALLMALEDGGELEEGVIIRDANGRRFKWKTKRYLALHRLKDNGNIIMPNRLVDIVLTGETPEVLAVMPEITSALAEVTAVIDKAVEELNNMWFCFGDYASQKKFALKVKDHKLSWVLFHMKKKEEWNDSGNYQDTIRRYLFSNSKKVAETLFGKRTFEFDVIEPDE